AATTAASVMTSRARSSPTCSRSGRRASWLTGRSGSAMTLAARIRRRLVQIAPRPSLVRRGVLVGDVGPRCDLGVVAVAPGDRASEFFESLAESAAGLGEAFGSEE